jgi:Co/Zn/Cd efflux system component
MGHDHAHHLPSGPAGSASGRHSYRLGIALGLTLTYMSAEVIGGILTGSLALLADAAHMLTDAAGLGLALLAIRFAARPATAQKTYGYMRAIHAICVSSRCGEHADDDRCRHRLDRKSYQYAHPVGRLVGEP